MRFIVTDLKRIFTEPTFYISMALNLLLLALGIAFASVRGETDRLFLFSQSFALPFVAPLLAAMPYSVMIMPEKETCYSSLMNIKLCAGGYDLTRHVSWVFRERRRFLFHSSCSLSFAFLQAE